MSNNDTNNVTRGPGFVMTSASPERIRTSREDFLHLISSFSHRVAEITMALEQGETVYEASPLKERGPDKRRRATKDEMFERGAFLVAYAEIYQPVTVRQLFYAATVHNLPGITKDDAGYVAVQRRVLELRREGQMPYSCVADSSRIHRKPATHNGWEAALAQTAETYRKALWNDHDHKVEVWLEKEALSGVIVPVTAEYDVSLMPTKGFTSETFAYNAVDALRDTGKALHAYTLYDFDRAGRDAASSLREKLHRFGDDMGVEVHMHQIALSHEQVVEMDLPHRPAKRKSAADKKWPYEFAAELDAIRPDILRNMVRGAIEQHLPKHELDFLKEQEQREREQIRQFVNAA